MQKGRDRTGLGLGLSICLKAVEAVAGKLLIRDVPGQGCVFTIDLPKQPPPPTSLHGRKPSLKLVPPKGGGAALARARLAYSSGRRAIRVG